MRADERHRVARCQRAVPAPVRDLLLQLAVTDIYKARWTADIDSEWIENLLENEPHRQRADLDRTRDLINKATRDALVHCL